MVLGCYSNIKAGLMDPVAPADLWNLFRKLSGTPLAPHLKVSGGLLGNFQAWSRVNLRTILTSWFRFPAPQGTGSGEKVGRVPQGLKALTGPPTGLLMSSSPYIDFSLTRSSPTGPNGLIICGQWSYPVSMPVTAGYNIRYLGY